MRRWRRQGLASVVEFNGKSHLVGFVWWLADLGGTELSSWHPRSASRPQLGSLN